MRLRQLASARRELRENAEQGSITAFATMMVLAFVVVAGLLVDGGLALAAKTAAITDAQDAARTAESAIYVPDLRHGTVHLDTGKALTAARRYLAAAGDTGTVQINGIDVTVVARRQVRTQILRLAGVGTLTETGTATAHLEAGITRPVQITTTASGSGTGSGAGG